MEFVCHKPHSALGLEEQLKGESENQTQGAKAPILAKNPRRERLQNLMPGSQKALNQTGQLRLFTWYSPNQFPRESLRFCPSWLLIYIYKWIYPRLVSHTILQPLLFFFANTDTCSTIRAGPVSQKLIFTLQAGYSVFFTAQAGSLWDAEHCTHLAGN